MNRYILGLHELDKTQATLAGGKGAALGELSRIEGIQVPPGFCVTTAAYRQIAQTPELQARLDRLSTLKPDDLDATRTLTTEIRAAIESTPIPNDIASAITEAVTQLGAHNAYAVRSSATAEDLPNTSFAGQHDTFLN